MNPKLQSGARMVASVVCLSILTSCTIFRPPVRTPADLPLPKSYTLYGPTAPAPERWWEAFRSEELNGLVAEALSGNFTLREAVARVRQAGRVAKQAGAPRWPALDYGTDASVTRRHTDTGESTPIIETAQQKLSALNTLVDNASAASTTTSSSASSLPDLVIEALEEAQSNVQMAQSNITALDNLFSDPASSEMTFTTESYGLGLTMSYELDLWGRLRASQRSAVLDLEATREDLYAAMQTIAGQVVLSWLDLLLEDQVLAILDDQLEANETTLELIELRYRKGLATALDVYQQRQAVEQVRATIPPLEAQRQVLLHQLAVLMGRTPRSDLELAADTFPSLGVLPEQGLPADLLAQRPDVRAAGLRLRSADWEVCAARADRLPTINLTGSASYGAEEWDLLFDNWMAVLGASVTGPLFDAGRRKAEVERTRAVVDRSLAAYKGTVLTAIQEVENALVLESRQREYITALKAQSEAAHATHREALGRYQKGLSDYLPVLSALTNAQSLERSLVQAEHDLLMYRVQLHLALGGSWMEQEPLLLEG